MDNFIAARSQMGMCLAFHIIFATIGVSLPLMTIISEWRWRSTGDPVYRSGLTIVNSAAPANIVSDLVIAVAIGALVLVPSLIMPLLVFKTHRQSISVGADTTAV